MLVENKVNYFILDRNGQCAIDITNKTTIPSDYQQSE